MVIIFPGPPRKPNGLPEKGWRQDGTRTSYALKLEGSWGAIKSQLDDDFVDCHTLTQLKRLKEFYFSEVRKLRWNPEFINGLTHEFNAHEQRIIETMEVMSVEELAAVPLRDALVASLRLKEIPTPKLGEPGPGSQPRPQPQEPDPMNINEAFPSKYLKASDIPEEGQTVVISRVVEEEVGRDKEFRPVLYFEGEEKGIVLNKTNATNISKLYGYETDDWRGKKVLLGTAWVDFQGQSTEGIRIYPPKRSSANAPLGSQKNATGRDYDERNPPPHTELEDSEIPF